MGSRSGVIRYLNIQGILNGQTVSTVDFPNADMGTVSAIHDCLPLMHGYKVLVAVAAGRIFFGTYDTLIPSLSFLGFETSLLGKQVLQIKKIPANSDLRVTSFSVMAKNGDN